MGQPFSIPIFISLSFFTAYRDLGLSFQLYSITVWSAAPQTTLSGGPAPTFESGMGGLIAGPLNTRPPHLQSLGLTVTHYCTVSVLIDLFFFNFASVISLKNTYKQIEGQFLWNTETPNIFLFRNRLRKLYGPHLSHGSVD